MRTSINELNCNEQLLLTKLLSWGILHIDQIQDWSLEELNGIKNLTKDEAYRLYLSIREWVSGEPNEIDPIELLCFENSEKLCKKCNRNISVFKGLYYPNGLQKLAFSSKETQYRYKPYFHQLTNNTSYDNSAAISLCLNCKSLS